MADEQQAMLNAVIEEAARYRRALRDALEGMEEMLPYVPEYFVEKWNLDGYVERAIAALPTNGYRPTNYDDSLGR